MTPLDAIELSIFSGVPFTYGSLGLINARHGGNEGEDRLADRTIQRHRRKGLIAYTREGRDTVWRLTDTGIDEQRRRQS